MKPPGDNTGEPTAGLNPKAHEDILKMIMHIHEEEKNIIFLVSHNMNDIARLCDKVLVMDHGRLVMDGTAAEVFSRGVSWKRWDSTYLTPWRSYHGSTLPAWR